MSMFAWKDEYGIGHGPIDGQHQRLFALANDLHAAMSQGKGKAALFKTLDALINYTKTHFATEERLMQAHGYPDYAAHKALHDELTKRVMAFQKDFEAGQVAMSVDLLQFLKDWLTNHIGVTDRKVAEFLKSEAA
jgi:hemerythrin